MDLSQIISTDENETLSLEEVTSLNKVEKKSYQTKRNIRT